VKSVCRGSTSFGMQVALPRDGAISILEYTPSYCAGGFQCHSTVVVSSNLIICVSEPKMLGFQTLLEFELKKICLIMITPWSRRAA